MILVAHLTRKFGDLVALEQINFEIGKGEVVGFLGPNGAGKTTLLRILSGYLPATSGAARVAGFDVMHQSLEVRQRIGYLPESVPLYREHRVIEMLEFQARLHGLSRADTKRRIPEVLERVGVLARQRDLIGNLSRGLRQRVGLAVALLPDPEILILDEPTSGLDPLQRLEVRGLVRELGENHTVLLSSHILPEIESVCPRVIILHEGRIAADGRREDLVKKMSGRSHVRLEAFVGGDLEKALRLLRGLPGVREVIDRGRLGVHHQFDIRCEEDLREDVGALAATCGWALRELSWQRPTLEEIFARIALGLGEETGAVEPQAGAPALRAGAPALESGAPATTISAPASSTRTTSSPAPAAKAVYNLNPFDKGASRDLGQPKTIDTPVRAEPRAEIGSPACEAPREDPGDSVSGAR